ncbi:hypothetical protein AABB02_13055 [Streptomyces rimosus]|uniref:hypothetical protein n=1 Tax=Streptomyces rimosus TaxID=1927 RepID=UPI0031D977A4
MSIMDPTTDNGPSDGPGDRPGNSPNGPGDGPGSGPNGPDNASGDGPGHSPDAPTDGPLAFQLVLLRRMADHQPGLVEDALRTLGASRADLREANRRWQAWAHSPRSRGAVGRYRSLLGRPESVTTRRIGDLTCEALTWPVPLWPDLRFEVLTGPQGTAWNAWLVRAPGAPGPDLRTTDDLVPWSCTVDEVARAFAPARPMEGTAPTRWRLAFTAPDAQGERRATVAEFTWGLLQRTIE